MNWVKQLLTRFANLLVNTGILNFLFRNFFIKLDRTLNRTSENIDEFITKNHELLKNVEFSHSFSPEQMDWVITMDEFKTLPHPNSLEALKTLTEQVGLRSVRLGIRWNTVDNSTDIDLSKYKDLIQHCLNQNLDLCLNIGPVKTFRWPEVFIPQNLIDQMPADYHEIMAGDLISTESLDYLKRLFSQFRKEFGEDFFSRIKTIQPENEMFNPFGPSEWTVSEGHVVEIVKLITEYFPHSKILFSVSGGPNGNDIFSPDISKAQKLIHNLKEFVNPDRLVIGFNYYYKVPGMPVDKNGIVLDNFSFLQFFDGKDILENTFMSAKENNYSLKVSEIQFEPWGEYTSPGTSIRELEFSLLRVLEELNISNYGKKFEIRLWGSEILAQKVFANLLSKEEMKILELIKRIPHSQ